MDKVTMTVTTLSNNLTNNNNNSNSKNGDRNSVSVAVAPSQLPSEAGATVYVADNPALKVTSPSRSSSSVVGSSATAADSNVLSKSSECDRNYQSTSHVVKIKINPVLDTSSKVISSVHLTPDIDSTVNKVECFINCNNNYSNDNNYNINTVNNDSNTDTCVRICVNDTEEMLQRIPEQSTCFYYGAYQSRNNVMMSSGQCSPSDTLDSGTCSDLDGTPPPLPKKKSSSTTLLGQSLSLSAAAAADDNDNDNDDGINYEDGSCVIGGNGQHTRTGSLTSSGAEIDSDDNESNVSCDSLNRRVEIKAQEEEEEEEEEEEVGRVEEEQVEEIVGDKEIKSKFQELNLVNDNENNNRDNGGFKIKNISSGTSLSKTSSATRINPNPLVNGQPLTSSSVTGKTTTPAAVTAMTPVVKECTYEERKREQEQEQLGISDYGNNINNSNNYNDNTNANANGNASNAQEIKYVYDDDRYYKFHINELEPDANDDNKKDGFDCETEEYFAGYKILDKEAIRSAKGTVRGVKNRVRAGIATFLQNPSSKNFRQKDAGKVVVYTTSMGVVPKTRFACLKMRHILNTHMVQYEERDLYRSSGLQTELKDRLASDYVQVPQLFIDGQHIGDADAIEQLNESGNLRSMLKPYKFHGIRKICAVCGDDGFVPCISCHGSKKSWRWHGFLNEICALRCTNCDEMGLMPCPMCLR